MNKFTQNITPDSAFPEINRRSVFEGYGLPGVTIL